jgi:hypothetical protein
MTIEISLSVIVILLIGLTIITEQLFSLWFRNINGEGEATFAVILYIIKNIIVFAIAYSITT